MSTLSYTPAMNFAQQYVAFIRWLSDTFLHLTGDTSGVIDTVLHIHAGMAVLFLARLVTRRSLATPMPVACVYLAELINEVLDYYGHGRLMPDTFADFVNTVFWPTVLFIGLRIRQAREIAPSGSTA